MSIEKKRGKTDLSRRRFIAGGLTAAAALSGVGEGVRLLNREDERPQEPIDPKDVMRAPERYELDMRTEFLRYEAKPKWYETPKLVGKKFGYPINVYFGYNNPNGFANDRPKGKRTESFEGKTSVDYKYQLAQACMLKAYKLGIVKAEGAPQVPILDGIKYSIEKNAGDPRIQLLNKIVMEYDPENCGQMSLQEYYDSITYAIGRVNGELDWQRIQHDHKLSGTQTSFLRFAAKRADAEALFSINLTEIMHSEDPAVLDVFETLLKTAGSQFVYRIPSDADLRMSFGPEQNIAELFKTVKNGKVRLGSVAHMSHYLKHSLVPEEIGEVEGAQHHMAAYLNAIDNLILLSRKLSDEHARQLQQQPIGDDIRVFVGAAHNNPGAALEAFERFSKAYLFTSEHHGKAKPAYAAFTKPVRGFADISQYAERMALSMAVVRYGGKVNLASR